MSTPIQAVAIGASAGALEALSAILPPLPATYALPIFLVVHLPADKKSILVELLQSKCALRVNEAEDKQPIKPGHLYIAPPDYHLLIEKDGYVSLSSDEPVLYSRPSVDVMFESAADAYGEGLLGIVLTGASSDGAEGMRAIMAAGGKGLVIRPEHAYNSTMPEAAIKACPDAEVLGIREIADRLKEAA